MSPKKRSGQPSGSEHMRGGKGRRDEVGKTGIHPLSAGTAPAGAVIRGQEELGHSPKHGETLQETPKKTDDRHDKAHDRSVRDSEIRRETHTSAAMGRLPGTAANPPEDEE